MAWLETASSDGIGQTYLRVTIRGLQYPADNYYSLKIKCVGVGERNAGGGGSNSGGYYTNAQTFTPLSSGTRYSFYAEAKYTSTSQTVRIPSSGYEYFTTSSPPKPTTPSIPTVSGGSASGLRVTWNIYFSSGTTTLYIDRDFGDEVSVNVSSSPYTYSYTASSYNKQLGIRAKASNSGGTSYYSGWSHMTTESEPSPAKPTITGSVSGKTASLTVKMGSNTSYIEFEDHNRRTSYYYQTSNNISLTVPNFNSTYEVRARGRSGNLSSDWTTYTIRTGADTTAPSISITNVTATSGITVAWVASDNDELRADNRYILYLGSVGGNFTSLASYGYTNDSSFTFTQDRNGNVFESGGVYPVRVGAYDRSGNYGYADRYVTVTKTRPANFNWTYSKTSGSNFNLRATEWNALISKLNEFRLYKGLAPLTNINTVSSGQTFYAYQYNQIINGLVTLSPTTSPPSIVSTGNTITASGLNRLRDSLNSVT